MHPDLAIKVEAEFNKLVTAGLQRKYNTNSGLTNVVPVLKQNEQIQVYIDFRDLNKACPKDDFLVPHMKMLVDSKTYYETFSFMDGYLGYNKIKIHLEDKEMTALSPKSVFLSKLCYLT